MAIKIQRKKIIISSRKPIYAKGWSYGPITMPYHEDINIIKEMLRQKLDVYEEVKVGTLLKLDNSNFNTDNSDPVLRDTSVLNVDAKGNYELVYADDSNNSDVLVNNFKVNELETGSHNLKAPVTAEKIKVNKEVEDVGIKVPTPEVTPKQQNNKAKNITSKN